MSNFGFGIMVFSTAALVASIGACAQDNPGTPAARDAQIRAGQVTLPSSRFATSSDSDSAVARIDVRDFTARANELERARMDPFANWPDRFELIVNGTSTFLFATAGALLKGSDPDDARLECSGTMIGCETFLTANHCIEDGLGADDYHVYLQTHGILPISHISEPPQMGDGNTADMVLVRLANPADSVVPAKTDAVSTLSGELDGRIVGFGHTGFLVNDHGIKRFATVKTSACEPPNDSMTCWHYNDNDELGTTCHVDSGGPLYVSDGNGDAVLVGVTSNVDAQCSDDTQYSDVNVQFYSDWIADKGGSDVAASSCGTGAVDENPFTEMDVLEPGEAHEFHVDVPASSGTVVVSLNGQEDDSMNFDLEAVLVSSDSVALDSCAKNGAGNFASCHFTISQPGAKVLGAVVQNGSEKGEFQLMVSTY
jgi:hypothetical protein